MEKLRYKLKVFFWFQLAAFASLFDHKEAKEIMVAYRLHMQDKVNKKIDQLHE